MRFKYEVLVKASNSSKRLRRVIYDHRLNMTSNCLLLLVGRKRCSGQIIPGKQDDGEQKKNVWDRA
jgi:hypothetical protein